MTRKKESFPERCERRLLRGEFKRSEDVVLYPLSLFFAMESLLLPVPVYTSNRDYLTASPSRRRLSIVARAVQVTIYAALTYLTAWVLVLGILSPREGTVFILLLAPLLILFFIFNIVLSLQYTRWLVHNFRSQWMSYRN